MADEKDKVAVDPFIDLTATVREQSGLGSSKAKAGSFQSFGAFQ